MTAVKIKASKAKNTLKLCSVNLFYKVQIPKIQAIIKLAIQ
jgi:hypothetical protein